MPGIKVKNTVCDPPFNEWKSVAHDNRSAVQALAARHQCLDIEELRRSVINTAHAFTTSLRNTAIASGLDGDLVVRQTLLDRYAHLSTGNLLSESICLAGHQPIIFHCGIEYKTFLLDQFSRLHNGCAIHIIIDLDEGDGGAITLPTGTALAPAILKDSLGTNAGLFYEQKLLNPDLMSTKIDLLLRVFLGESPQRERLAQTLQQYVALTGESVVIANEIVRRHYEQSPEYLEVPLSHLCRDPKILSAFSQLIGDPEAWTTSFNSRLNRFREENGVKNAANPFPNLKVVKDRFELPFWIIDTRNHTRSSCYGRLQAEQVQLFAGEKFIAEGQRDDLFGAVPDDFIIAPKAFLITYFLRLVIGDLFIHGLGGAHYDAFTDFFIAEEFSLPAPRFAIASTSRYLFSDERAAIETSSAESEKRRQIYFHPERFIEQGLFSESTSESVRALSEQKKSYIELIKRGKELRESTAEVTQQVKRIEREIRAIVDEALGPLIDSPQPPRRLLDIFYFREFPYFLFSKDYLL